MKRKRYAFIALACVLAALQATLAQTPPAPTNLVAQVVSSSVPTVRLTWQAPIASTNSHQAFKIYRSQDDSLHLAVLNVTFATKYEDHQVVPGHTYYYAVTMLALVHDTTIAESNMSNIASATVGPPPHGRGVISGVVVDSLSGNPLSFIRILFYRVVSSVAWVPQTWTDANGKYSAVVDTGTYLINARPLIFWVGPIPVPLYSSIGPVFFPLYLPEWYKDARNPADATPVHVADNENVVVNFDLEKVPTPVPAGLSGTVMDSAGVPLKHASVAILRSIQDLQILSALNDDRAGVGNEAADIIGLGHCEGVVWKGFTDSLGHYQASLLTGRSYIILAAKPGYHPQYFDHKQNPLEADVIRLSNDTSGIDFNLLPIRPVVTYSISGTVRDSTGVGVPSHIVLLPLRPLPRWFFLRFGTTDSVGAYSIGHVLPGKYFVLAVPFSKYAPSFYKAGQFGVFHRRDADTVTVAGDVSGIDIGVVMIHSSGVAQLTGSVASNGKAVEGANVLAMDATAGVVGYGLTDASGKFTIDGVPAGQITLSVEGDGYLPANSAVSVGQSDFVVNGVNFSLTPDITVSVGATPQVPESYGLDQNYPNPFNPSTKISYLLPVASNVTLKIYNLLGQEVATLVQGVIAPGKYQIVWNGTDNAGKALASGMYFYRLDASAQDGGQSFTSIRKMLLLK